MFSPELENLIQATLEDGILEVKEKAALIKRAQAEGVDIAELEIYINSILQKRKREADKEKNAKQEQIAQKKKKALRTCPNCGASLPVMAISCPKCGFELSDQKALSSIEILANKIEKISVQLTNRNVNEDEVYNQIINTISLAPVPNSKQDIIEFLALSCTKAKYKGGLWGSTLGRLKIYVTIALAIGIICGIMGLITGIDAWFSGIVFFELIFLVFGGMMFFWSFSSIINENKVAAAWREKFEQVMFKGRSLRADAEFTQQLDFYESKLNSK